ncbi:MAG: Integral membrane protein YggT, involved in response to extracytoplasmic stress (osmotic shock) [uncultured Chloroflexi bacterium]|uniref:Integral membrane protein YggT, involved in response to extracytoplasmic stress (Osmotic shock) n=1 Tax=uncultured Chloroflexota bacterium TaxID=166587 RepID=A0A6J4KIW0_9CHLR|nr:MAG: Integral membrane protein YggT, involved in response to extracytoplasmic stress (osmotic shock) [uncultured Chloroflexota bacterium]
MSFDVFNFAISFVDLLVTVLFWAILLRSIFTWFDQTGSSPISRILFEVTEPIIAPLRRVVPSVGMLDLSPMVAMILVQLIGRVVVQVLYTAGGR